MRALDPRTVLHVFWLGLAGLCLTLGVVRWWPAPSPENPAYDALSQALSRRIAADSLALDSAQVRLRAAAEGTTATITRYVKLRDTLRISDTVAVKVYVQHADSVVRACTALVESCGQFRVRAESTIADLRLDRDRWKRATESLQPSGLERVWSRVRVPLAFGVGLYAGSRVVR